MHQAVKIEAAAVAQLLGGLSDAKSFEGRFIDYQKVLYNLSAYV